ncbi:PadR family transcriptional regulator [Oscillospiraceae bacterium MB08-C2-2]|nr:PadR family transcriptional regulator [Oscillospiraceae bacterium MB08-C2-2]
MTDEELVRSLIVDLRRGTLVLAVLSSLGKAQYGYSLLQDMESKGIHIESNTLYPLLRRLETQGLLQSQWDTAENRPRKYYILSDRGQTVYVQLRKEWLCMTREMNNLLKEADV